MKKIVLLFLAFTAFNSNAAEYPDMVGAWLGTVRVVESGGANSEVARGGMNIRDTDLKVQIQAQDGETFMGYTLSSATPSNQTSARVWGTIRSNAEEAIFITSNGARGQIWFQDASTFEFCVTNLDDELFTAYCATLSKEAEQD